MGLFLLQAPSGLIHIKTHAQLSAMGLFVVMNHYVCRYNRGMGSCSLDPNRAQSYATFNKDLGTQSPGHTLASKTHRQLLGAQVWRQLTGSTVVRGETGQGS